MTLVDKRLSRARLCICILIANPLHMWYWTAYDSSGSQTTRSSLNSEYLTKRFFKTSSICSNDIILKFQRIIPLNDFTWLAFVGSKLLYGLSSSWLYVAEQRRLDGFQARCLRRMFNIKHSYFRRVSNREVLKRSKQISLSSQLPNQQLRLFRKIYCLSDGHFLRELIFGPGT